MVQYGYRRARNKYTFKFKLTNGHQHYDTSHTRTTTISGIPMVLMPKVIGMEALSENSITSKTLQPIKGPDKQTTQKARPRGNVLQRPETPSPQSGKKRMQPDTMTTPTAPRHKKTQQTHQEEILLPPVILNVKEGFQRFEEEDNSMEEDKSGLEYISQYNTSPEVLFEESTYPYLQNFCDLTGELAGLASLLKKQGHLEDILKDEAVAKNLEELAGILPATPIDLLKERSSSYLILS